MGLKFGYFAPCNDSAGIRLAMACVICEGSKPSRRDSLSIIVVDDDEHHWNG